MAIGIRGFAGIVGVAALMVIGVACGGGNDEPRASADFDDAPAANLSETSVAPPGPTAIPTPKETSATSEPAADSTEPPVTSAASQAREQIRCFPTGMVARVGASVGDSWTLAGSIRLQGKTPEDPRELRDGGQSSVTFTLTGLDDGGRNWLMDEASGERARIENSMAHVQITTVYRDDEGNALEATDRDETGLPSSSTATIRLC